MNVLPDLRFRFLAAAACLALCLELKAAEPVRLSPSDIREQKARLEEGARLFEDGQLEEALSRFSDILDRDPSHARARLEKARTLAALGRPREARSEFEYVLKYYDPPPAVRANIQRFIDAIDERNRRFSVSGSTAAGVFYDDNVNYGPANRVIEMAPIDFGFTVIDKFTVKPESRPKESAGLLGMASAVALYDAGERAGWAATAGGTWYQSFLEDHDEFDTLLLGASAGLQHSRRDTRLDLPVRFQSLDRGGETVVQTLGFAPGFTRAHGQNSMTTVQAILQHRDYREQDARDAWYLDAGVVQTWTTGSEVPLFLVTRAGLFSEHADEDTFSNLGFRAGLGLSRSVLSMFTVGLQAGYRGKWFDERESFAADDRVDHEWIGTVSIRRKVFGDLSAQLTHQHTYNVSRVDLYEYRQNLSTFSLQMPF